MHLTIVITRYNPVLTVSDYTFLKRVPMISLYINHVFIPTCTLCLKRVSFVTVLYLPETGIFQVFLSHSHFLSLILCLSNSLILYFFLNICIYLFLLFPRSLFLSPSFYLSRYFPVSLLLIISLHCSENKQCWFLGVISME